MSNGTETRRRNCPPAGTALPLLATTELGASTQRAQARLSDDGELKVCTEHALPFLPATAQVAAYRAAQKGFLPRQRPASFSVDQGMEKVNVAQGPR